MVLSQGPVQHLEPLLRHPWFDGTLVKKKEATYDYDSVSVLGSHVVIAASTPWEFRWEFLGRSEDIYEEKIGSFQRFIIFSPFPFLRQSTSIVFKKSIHSDEFHSSFVNYVLKLLDNFDWKLNTHVWNFNKIAIKSIKRN